MVSTASLAGWSTYGDVVSQVVAPSALPPTIDTNVAAYQALEAAQKQLNAPFGQFGHDLPDRRRAG